MDSFDSLEKEIESIREEYYSESGKNRIFKKQQKYDCAKQVASQISLDVLLQRTCWIDSKTTYIHVDYPILKTYASPDVFEHISDHVIRACAFVKDQKNEFTVILNFDGFTVSAAERYKNLIEAFCNKCFALNIGLSDSLQKFIICNCPSAMESIKPILGPFMLEEVKAKIVLVNKRDTPAYLASIAAIIS